MDITRVSVQGAQMLMDHALSLCRLAKAANLSVTQSRVIDVCKSIQQIDWRNRDEVRLALRTNLVGSHADEIVFDRVFAQYWDPAIDDNEDHKPWRPELIEGQVDEGSNRGHEEITTAAAVFSPSTVQRAHDLNRYWGPESLPIETIIRELARRLATLPSRRIEPSNKGTRIDLRRSMRRNLSQGFDLLELARVRRRRRKTRMVLLCDVSGSMDVFNPFLLQLMLGLQQALKNSRTLVFSTKVTEISALLRRRSVSETLKGLGAAVSDWSGGTNIGGALAVLNRSVLREGSARSTVTVIISDGYDNGNAERIKQEMQVTQRLSHRLVWINPMYGASTFRVRAEGMRAAMPFIDHFLPAFNVKSLRTMVRGLHKI